MACYCPRCGSHTCSDEARYGHRCGLNLIALLVEDETLMPKPTHTLMPKQRTCSEIKILFSGKDAKNARDIKRKLRAWAPWRELLIPHTFVDSALSAIPRTAQPLQEGRPR